MPPFVERFQQCDDSCRVGFELFFPSLDSRSESYIATYSFWLSNVASLAISCITCGILHHAQIGQNTYTEYVRTIYINIYTSVDTKHHGASLSERWNV